MIASIQHAFVFFHVPKSAGTSIRRGLNEAFADDPTLIRYKGIGNGIDFCHPLPSQFHLLPKIPELCELPGCRIFAFVRDPYPRALSAFLQHRRQYPWHPDVCQTFPEFLEKIREEAYLTSPIFIHGAPQHRFLFQSGKPIAKRLFKVEEPGVFDRLSDYLGRTIYRHHLNRNREQEKFQPNREEIRLIRSIYREDYRIFSYDSENSSL